VKLYWRVKRNGKWTWRPVIVKGSQIGGTFVVSGIPVSKVEEE